MNIDDEMYKEIHDKTNNDIVESFHNKINIINNSIEIIVDELKNIDLNCKTLIDYTDKLNDASRDEYMYIINKINGSICEVNKFSYFLEINKLKKILKSHSGNNLEISDYMLNTNNTLDVYNISNTDNTNNYQVVIDYDNVVNSIEFDVNLYENKKILCEIAYHIFSINVDFNKIKISLDSLKKFIKQVSMYYHNNYFHNFKHAIMVLQFVHLLFNKIDIKNKLSQCEIFAILLAALVHDIDHPGHSNSFEINTQSNLALKYNNNSVLENHHCSLAFYLIHSKEIKLLENLERDDFIIVRDMIVECVLSTDMKHHFSSVENLEKKFYEHFNFNNIQDRIFIGKIIVHVADLSNQVRPFDLCLKYSIDLRKEYLFQVEKEIKLGLPVLEHMKLTDDKIFYSAEYYFSSNIVKPLWNILIEIFLELEPYYKNLETNIIKWKELLDLHK